jgi:hypothetical protein
MSHWGNGSFSSPSRRSGDCVWCFVLCGRVAEVLGFGAGASSSTEAVSGQRGLWCGEERQVFLPVSTLYVEAVAPGPALSGRVTSCRP